jgi:hypothetical protein
MKILTLLLFTLLTHQVFAQNEAKISYIQFQKYNQISVGWSVKDAAGNELSTRSATLLVMKPDCSRTIMTVAAPLNGSLVRIANKSAIFNHVLNEYVKFKVVATLFDNTQVTSSCSSAYFSTVPDLAAPVSATDTNQDNGGGSGP